MAHRHTKTNSEGQALYYERLRCLRYGALIRLFRHRYGHELPDDDAGQADIWLLVQNVSTAVSNAERKMRHAIELWAPWMPADKAEAMMAFAMRLPRFERCPTSQELGESLRITNELRLALKLWPFKPMDLSDDELETQRKARIAERRRERRRAKNVRSREEYLASVRKPKPWEVENISRRTFFRRLKRAQGSAQIIVLKAEHNPGQAVQAESQKRGLQGSAVGEGPAIQVAEVGEVETYQRSSHGLEQDPGHMRENERRLAAMQNWGANAKRRRVGTR